jgi:hypothetical protein
MVGNGDLYLVTGVTKSSSWSVAALENQSGDGKVSLKLKVAQAATAGVSCAWEWESASSSVNSGPRRRPGEESFRDNQTVFLRGYRVAVRSKPVPLRRSPKLVAIDDNCKWADIASKSTFVPFSQPRPGAVLTNDPPPSPPGSTPGTPTECASDDEESLDYIRNVSAGITI